MRKSSIKLGRRHKIWLYSTLIVVFLTGVAWAGLHYFVRREGEFGPVIHPLEPWSLKLHGAAAMLILIVLGTLVPLHVRGAWLQKRNRVSGGGLFVFFGLLTLTGYGLYYFGGETLRAWTSWLHLGLGVLLPAVLVLHIWWGRRS